MSGAAALGVLAPALAGLALAARAYLLARASQIAAGDAADSAGAAHERLDALGAVRPPAAAQENLEQLRAQLAPKEGPSS